jgi:thioredoxin reductase (NADPH)
LRDFWARNHAPYQWIVVELSPNDAETKRLLDGLGPEATNLPIALFPDGTKLLESAPAEIAQKVGCEGSVAVQFIHRYLSKVSEHVGNLGTSSTASIRGFAG